MTIIRDVITPRMGPVESPGEIDDHLQQVKKELEDGQHFRWQDGKGVMHELRGRVAFNVSVSTTIAWAPACGHPYASTRRAESAAPITCLKCLAAAPPVYMCSLCWKYPCVDNLHNYQPDFRFPMSLVPPP